MKTFRMIGMALLAVLMCVNFTSCSEDDDPTEVKNEYGVVVSGKKLVKVVSKEEDWVETRTYTYDDKGRLIEATETDEDKILGSTTYRDYQFTWGADKIIVSGDDSYILTLENGLVQNCENLIFNYNKSKKLLSIDDFFNIVATVTWDGDKLVSMDYENYQCRIKYAKSHKGYSHLIASLIDWDYDAILIEAHPEIFGIRTNQLPASIEYEYNYSDRIKTRNFEYEFDKDGYISKIKFASVEVTLTWE